MSGEQSTSRNWDDAVSDYEQYLEILSRQFADEAIAMVGGAAPGTSVLDVAAGTGALSIAAARSGARVLATDSSPAMVNRLAERLSIFPSCSAQVIDGQALEIADGAFDAAFCFFGIYIFPDWRLGLRELFRAVRPGGHGCVSTTRDPLGAGPNLVLFEALRAAFPERKLPPMPEAVTLLSEPKSLEAEMRAAGFDDVEVRAVERTWSVPSLDSLQENLDRIYSSYPPYVGLEPAQREALKPALVASARKHVAPGGAVEIPTVGLLAVGRKAERMGSARGVA